MTFQQVLDKYRKISYSEKDKGYRFERLMQAYLQTDPLYASRFSDVWLWNDFPAHKDSGITNNPNDWATEHHQPRYILDLLLSVIALSTQTVEIVAQLPVVNFDTVSATAEA